THRSPGQGCNRRRNRGRRIHPKPVGRQWDCGARYVAVTAGCTWSTACDGEHSGEQSRIRLLDHEQRDVEERLRNIESVAAAQNVVSVTGEVISETHTRAERLAIVVRDSGKRAVDRLEQLIGSAAGLGVGSHKVEVPVVAQSEV